VERRLWAAPQRSDAPTLRRSDARTLLRWSNGELFMARIKLELSSFLVVAAVIRQERWLGSERN